MLQIALYGKGGIGKSTISANLSAILAQRGKAVLQIGCDPKHDSTRLLLGGASLPTVLDYIRTSMPGERSIDDIMFKGYGGVACIEAGGPEPGVGCAGRGILTTFEMIENLGIRSIPFDVVLYDVLGDVVCGGFAIPIRKQYADAVFLVTSGEYMALYAANNILKGISNFNDNGFRVAGIIHNSRGTLNEGIRVRAFADAVGLPVVVTIPRSEDFASAEKEGCTLAELSLDCALLDIFKDLAHHVESLAAGSAQLYPALPLEDDRLEVVVLGKTRRSFKTRSHASPSFQKERTRDEFPFADKGNMFLTKSMKHKQPLRGCSFAGAVTATSHVYNALTIAHGPRSCAHIVSHFLTSTSLSARSRYGTPLQTSMYDLPVPTDMGEKAFIFGGADELRHTMELAVNRGYKTIFVVSTCPPGLIGDDIDRIAGDMKQCYTDTRFVTVPVDGNIAGDFAQGLVEGYRKVLELADNSVKVKERTVNIIGEKVLSSNAGYNYDTIKKLLDEIGLQVNCRFLYHAGVEDIASICRAEFNLLAHNDESGKVLKEYLQSELGCEFLGLPFPIGFRESAEWLELLAERFCMEDKAREMIRVRKELYDSEISKLRPALRGKRLLISSFNPDIDWVIETALDLGMHVLKVGLAFSPETIDFRSRYIGMLPVDFDYDFKKRDRDITELAPDLILSNYPPLIHKAHAHHDSIPISPDVGFNTGLVMARRWDTLLKLPVAEGWRIDGDDTHDN